LTFPSYGDGCKLLPNGKLRLQGIGELKIKQHRQIPEGGKIKTIALLRDGDYYYACFACEIPLTLALEPTDKQVGIDAGLTTYATLSDGEKIENPRILKNNLVKLATLQRALSACAKRNAKKAALKRRVRALYRKIANQRNDFQHKETLKLVQEYDLIAVEKLRVADMLTSKKKATTATGTFELKLNKHISDAAWASFFSKLSYKASSTGRKYVEVNAKNSSQECLCGKKVPKTLLDRWHACPSCGLSEPRDLVSSKIILRRGLRLLELTPNEAVGL
jgi:putative transposase